MAIMAADIETGAQPDADLLRLYEPPERPKEFDPARVEVGRATKKETIDKKIAEAKAEFELLQKDGPWAAHCEQHQAAWLTKTREKAALDPLTGRVLAIGWQRKGDEFVATHCPGDEHDILAGWWDVCSEQFETGDGIVFHNGYGFDLPFLTRRSWLLDIPVPTWMLSRGRFNQDFFLDTMAAWTMGKFNEFVKLDTLAKAFGVEGKLKGCTGADFARMFLGTPKEKALALRYLEQDVKITLRLAQLMGM